VTGSEYPSADGVGVESFLAVDAGTEVVWATAGFLAIFDLVSRAGTADSVVTTTGFGGGTRLILDRVIRCGGVSIISLSSSSTSL